MPAECQDVIDRLTSVTNRDATDAAPNGDKSNRNDISEHVLVNQEQHSAVGAVLM